jgi:hypothetical protein
VWAIAAPVPPSIGTEQRLAGLLRIILGRRSAAEIFTSRPSIHLTSMTDYQRSVDREILHSLKNGVASVLGYCELVLASTDEADERPKICCSSKERHTRRSVTWRD